MFKTKIVVLILPLTILVTGVLVVSIFPQAAYAQTDYEAYMITETSNEQKLKQENTGSSSSTNINCGTNVVADNTYQPITPTCPNIPGETPTIDKEFTTTIVSSTTRIPFPTSRGTA